MSYIVMKNITKVYPNGVLANDHASLGINKGEIHAIAGENGAGKSTIMKVLFGAEEAAGEVFLDGRKVDITSPRVANSLGIGMVYQHFMLVCQFTVWENIFFGNEIKGRLGKLRKRQMIETAQHLCDRFCMHLDVEKLCSDLTVAEAQKAEILKVLARGAQIVILDEPTAVLTPQEIQFFFNQLRKLRDEGYTIIIITHKLKEIKELCDRVTIMRQGKTIGTYEVSEISEAEISRLMIGRDLSVPKKTKSFIGKTLLNVSNLSISGTSGRKAVHGVNFELKAGEILCFAGVEGNGQHEVVNAIAGMDKDYSGTIMFKGNPINHSEINDIRKAGIGYIPEDRLRTGSIPGFSVFENLISDDFYLNSRFGFLEMKKLKRRSLAQMEEYSIRGTIDNKLSELSGGNVQKVVIARELEGDPSLVIADQPTRGVDIGAIESIHRKIIEIRDSGKAVLLVSADLSEVLNISDRILVFHNGEITAEIIDVSSTDEIQLGKYMLGVDRMEGLS